jgi:hypothetical protein
VFGPSRFISMKTVATEYPQADCIFWQMHFESLSGFSLRAFPNTIMRLYVREPVQVGTPRPKSVRLSGMLEDLAPQSHVTIKHKSRLIGTRAYTNNLPG